MKKIVSLFIALAVFSGVASAQIKIEKTSSAPKQLTTLSMSWSWIYGIDSSYYIVMKSENQFDDYYWMKIGSTQEECLESIDSLQELCDTIGETDAFRIDNGQGEIFRVTKYKAFGMNGLYFRESSRAGAGYILGSNLSKARKWVEKNVSPNDESGK